MKVIDKYIVKQFLMTFIFAMLLLNLITIVIDVTEKIDNFIANQAPFKAVMFDYYLHFVPYITLLLAPIFVFISVIYFTSRLTSNTEVICMLNGGVSFNRLLVPYTGTAIFLASVFAFFNHYALPQSNARRIAFEEVYSTKKDKKVFVQNYHFQIGSDTFLFTQNFDAFNRSGYKLCMEKIVKKELLYRLEAENMRWDSTSSKWKLTQYTIRIAQGRNDRLIKGPDTLMYLPVTPKEYVRQIYDIETMTTSQLKKFIKDQRRKGSENVKFFELEQHRRTAIPFSVIILTLIGVAMTTHKVRSGMGIYLVAGLFISGAYVIIQQFSSVFATQGNLDPLIGAWVPNIIFIVVAAVLLKRAPK
jgi:lipopolysaccharide export system permease protein